MLKQWSITEKHFRRYSWAVLLAENFEFWSRISEHGQVWSDHAEKCVWNNTKRIKQIFCVINLTVVFVNSGLLWCMCVQNLEEGFIVFLSSGVRENFDFSLISFLVIAIKGKRRNLYTLNRKGNNSFFTFLST